MSYLEVNELRKVASRKKMGSQELWEMKLLLSTMSASRIVLVPMGMNAVMDEQK